MSWSLAISNGDFALSGNGMGTVEGAGKLIQDLRCAVLEPMGTDDLHPSYGSTIDGGTLPDGTYSQGILGQQNDAYAAAYVEAEIRRIANQYQAQQQARYQSDIATYGRATLTADEALLAVEHVAASTDKTTLFVNVGLQTGTGSIPLSVATSAS